MLKSRVTEIMERFREFVQIPDFQETPILTAYVNVDPTNSDNRKDRPAWLIDLKNEAKQLESGLDQEKLKRRATQNKWANTEDMVTRHLTERKPTGRSVVFFTNHELFLDVDLPLPTTTRLYYGLPQLKHLLFQLDQYKKYVVVLLSGSELRVVEVFLARTTDEVRIDTGQQLMARLGRSGHSHKHESRSDEFDRRFIKQVATGINEFFLTDPDFERLILGGNAKHAHAVKNALHPAVREALVGIEQIDFKLGDNDVAQRVKAIADEHELEQDLAIVDELVSCSQRGGRAVLEQQGVIRALEQQKVKTLVLPYPVASDEFDSLIVDATLNGADIEFVYAEAAEKLSEFGGIGAVLYHAG